MNIHFSSESAEWSTPQEFFDELDVRFSFNLDPCATVENAKCKQFFTIEDSGLEKSWYGKRVFVNPPYGRGISTWVKKAFEEAQKGALVVCLLPARTDTRWWHDYCRYGDVILLKGRLKFGGSKNSAPFPSAVVIFRGFEQ